MKGRHRLSNKFVAIKKIDCSFDDTHYMMYVLRELTLLRQLSEMEGNHFTNKLLDVVVPEEAYEDIMRLKSLFFVMEYIPHDLTSVLAKELKDDEKNESQLI